MPTWQDEIAKGLVPYHQVTAEDFRIDDKTNPDAGYSIKPFIDPRYHYLLMRNGDWYYAYLEKWVIFSGLDKNQSWRKSKFREMQRALPHAQAYLDLNEIGARQLAVLKPGELPSGRGATPPEAAAALHQNLDVFLKEKYKALQAEADEFQKATNRGTNTKKVIELGKAIRKRLDALPAPNGPGYDLPAGSPTPSPSSTPKK
ncbi:MAG TPA: hypothetical protein VIM09_09495 [Chthoniobacterales bacterium]